MSTFQYIISIALGQGIILAFFLLTSRYYRSRANTWLALTLVILSLLSIFDIVGSQYFPESKLLAFLFHDLELSFLVYVPLYHFFRISTSHVVEKASVHVALFVPFVIDTIINILIVSYFPIESIDTHQGIQIFYEIETFASLAFNLFLNYKSYQFVHGYVSDSTAKSWLLRIWQSTSLLLIAWILMILGSFLLASQLLVFISALYISISIWMFWLIYNGIVNLKLIDDRKNISLKLQEKPIQNGHENVSSGQTIAKEIPGNQYEQKPPKRNDELFDRHFTKIKALMTSELLYRNEDLSIDELAGRFEMSAGYISKIIKKATGKNFPTWINEFRVADAKTMFADKEFEQYTTLSIGLESGFKSKSAFYASFKNITGETPAKFRKKKS